MIYARIAIDPGGYFIADPQMVDSSDDELRALAEAPVPQRLDQLSAKLHSLAQVLHATEPRGRC